METKASLINQLISEPRKFSENALNELLNKEDFSFKDLRPMMMRIFDVNLGTIKNASEADQGILGKLNKRSRRIREKQFWEKIKKFFEIDYP